MRRKLVMVYEKDIFIEICIINIFRNISGFARVRGLKKLSKGRTGKKS